MSARTRTACSVCWCLSLVAWSAIAVAAGLGVLAVAGLARTITAGRP